MGSPARTFENEPVGAGTIKVNAMNISVIVSRWHRAALAGGILVWAAHPAAASPAQPGQSGQAVSTQKLAPIPFDYSHDPILGPEQKAFNLRSSQSIQLSRDGDAAAKQGGWKTAASDYQAALSLWSGNPLALYGMAHCAGAQGNIAEELNNYRTAIYNPATPLKEPTFREVNTDKLMEFALLLDQAGQVDEALRVYNHAVRGLNYDMGKPRLQVLLPEFGEGPDQEAYTPRKLEAMAHLAIGVFQPGFNDKELRLAVKMAPDSAAAHFYLGKELCGNAYEELDKEAKAQLEEAIRMGDAQTVAAANIYLPLCH